MISRETFDKWQKEVEEHLNLPIDQTISGIMRFDSSFGTQRPKRVCLEGIDYIIIDEINVKKVEKFASKKFRRTKNIY